MTKLEQAMERYGVTVEALAKESGYSERHIGNLRRGDVDPTLGCAKAMCLAMVKITDRRIRLGDIFDTNPAERKTA